MWSIPAGKTERSDRKQFGYTNAREFTAMVAARELREETGLDINPYELAGPVFGFDYGKHRVIFFQTYIGGDYRSMRELLPGDGIIDVGWFNKKACFTEKYLPRVPMSLAASEILPQMFPI